MSGKIQKIHSMATMDMSRCYGETSEKEQIVKNTGTAMSSPKKFILTEAAAMVPLVRRILVDVRSCRAEISRLFRVVRNDASNSDARNRLRQRREQLGACLREAKDLGVEISPGIRCEAFFPFDHQWIGRMGDRKLRPAYFLFSDAQPTITQWCFHGWPDHRMQVCEDWWKIRRNRPRQTV